MSDTPKKILSIEDDRFISEMYTRALRKAGYEVDQALNGEDAIKMAHKGDYDLLLLDIFIPKKTGIEVLHELKGAKKNKLPDKTKIVIMTNYMQDDDSRQALESEVDGYLIKANVVPSKLVELINQLLAE